MKTKLVSYCVGVLKPTDDSPNGGPVWHFTIQRNRPSQAKKALKHHPKGKLFKITKEEV